MSEKRQFWLLLGILLASIALLVYVNHYLQTRLL